MKRFDCDLIVVVCGFLVWFCDFLCYLCFFLLWLVKLVEVCNRKRRREGKETCGEFEFRDVARFRSISRAM